jgi:thymidylate synthase (FAD)
MKVELISKTQGLGKFENQSICSLIVGQARVSTSRELNDLFNEPHKLLNHCILNQHWSIFELANLGFSIETSRAMGRELLRHGKMVGLTEFSQRYSSDISTEEIELRIQSKSNRQSSTDVFIGNEDSTIKLSDAAYGAGSHLFYNDAVEQTLNSINETYKGLLDLGIARETARFILPETTSTKIYMNFRIRELITFLNQRLHKTAQKEIRLIAEQIRDIFIQECPIISKALFDFDNAYNVHILERIVLEKYKVYQNVINK